MALAIVLNEGGRQTIAILLVIIHLITLICGAGLCTVGFYLRCTLKSKVSLVDGYDGNVLPIVLMVVGGLTVLVNLVGSKLAFDVAHPANRKRLRTLLLVLLVLLLVVTVALLTAGSMCFAHRHHLSRSFHHGLTKAMGKYQEDHTLKYDIDMLQIQNECCGNNGYEDWFDIQWVNNMFLDLSISKIQSKMTSGQYLTDDVPFSCCRPTSPRPCIHHQIHDNDIHYNYDYATDLTLHPVGCKQKLMEYFGSKLSQLGAASFGLLGAQVLAILLTRYLQTSIAGAIAEGDPEASAPGFICPGGEKPAPSKEDSHDSDGINKPKMDAGKIDVPDQGKFGVDRHGGSIEDFENHDLDIEEGYDTLLDDSTFDDDYYDKPDTTYITHPTKSYNPYENDDRYGSEPIYENIGQYESETAYEEPIRQEEEPLYENIPAFTPAPVEDLYENIPAFAPRVVNDLYNAAPSAPLPPLPPAGPPPRRSAGPSSEASKAAPPPRPATGPRKPDTQSSSKSASPNKRPPPRPSQPPIHSSPGDRTSSRKKAPERPTKSPTKVTTGSQPKTSTPKKSVKAQSTKVNKTSIEKSPRSGVKKASTKSKRGATSSKASPKSKTMKRSPTKTSKSSSKRSPKRSTKSIGKAKSPPKWKMGPKDGKSRSPTSKRKGPKKTKMKRSRNKNNNILESSDEDESDDDFTSSVITISEDSDETSSSLDSSSLDLETGSSTGDSEQSDSSDTPLLRR